MHPIHRTMVIGLLDVARLIADFESDRSARRRGARLRDAVQPCWSEARDVRRQNPRTPPAAIFSYYEAAHRQAIVESANASGLPAGTRVYMGTYGVSQDDADAARAILGGQYAPAFSIVRGKEAALFAGRGPDRSMLTRVVVVHRLPGCTRGARSGYSWDSCEPPSASASPAFLS